ncbi:MAG: M15 family metallopeptidase [Oscillospiraceae bacterium]|nr:M15 family metallopeptidase [Oscillospiraceae bacterium]
MNKRRTNNKLPVIPIGLAICFMGIITFLFLHFTTQNEPDKGEKTPPAAASPDPNETPDISGGDNDPPEDDFFIQQANPVHIHMGSLLLVNKERSFDLYESELNLVLVNEEKTAPFQMRRDYVTKLCASVIKPLDAMMQAYIDEVGENTIYIYIGYRDKAAQQKTLDDFIASIGREAALRRVALPGHSEHHTGLAMDLGAMVDGVHHTFDYREANYHEPTKWFGINAHRFGFVLSFPEDRVEEGGTIYEPWHYRYVGFPHSAIMFQNNWLLSEYLDEIRKYTFEKPFTFEWEGREYFIYFTTDTAIKFPKYVENTNDRTLSGNNIDGFVVTFRK